MTDADRTALDTLERRLKTLLPQEYQDSYETMAPVPMRSAALKYGPDGKVAWNEIWGSFCDLAMAGGPPHKGTLLQPATAAEIDAQPEAYADVVAEICRGIEMATELPVEPSPVAGWVRVTCLNSEMAGWLLRAIVMENVAIRCEDNTIDLPAAPGYRLHKEIKNVVTVIAKTCHYWLGHLPRTQQRAIAALFAEIAAASPLIGPAIAGVRDRDGDGDGAGVPAGEGDRAPAAERQHAGDRLAAIIARETGLRQAVPHRYADWLGLECASVRGAIWMMRMLVVSNVLARREGTVLFVPIDPLNDPDGALVAGAVARVHRYAALRGLFQPA